MASCMAKVFILCGSSLQKSPQDQGCSAERVARDDLSSDTSSCSRNPVQSLPAQFKQHAQLAAPGLQPYCSEHPENCIALSRPNTMTEIRGKQLMLPEQLI